LDIIWLVKSSSQVYGISAQGSLGSLYSFGHNFLLASPDLENLHSLENRLPEISNKPKNIEFGPVC